MSKRKFEEIYEAEDTAIPVLEKEKKHTLDSDEEDTESDTNDHLDAEEIEGIEDGDVGLEGEIKITPFNMKEEMEEGHFDKDGHYQWDKSKDLKDNWLDNIDWIKIKERKNKEESDSDTSDEDEKKPFDVMGQYKKVLEMMQPKENVKKTLQRLGGKTAKMSSIERWKLKKSGLIDKSSELVTQLTEICNEILTRTGNMDIYEETYETIQSKYGGENGKAGNSSKQMDDLDMYADDFDNKEKGKLSVKFEEKTDEKDNIVMWEFKWKQEDLEIHGPFDTIQMQKWVEEKYFKDGVFVRKVGVEDSKFYASKRIDFEIYL